MRDKDKDDDDDRQTGQVDGVPSMCVERSKLDSAVYRLLCSPLKGPLDVAVSKQKGLWQCHHFGRISVI